MTQSIQPVRTGRSAAGFNTHDQPRSFCGALTVTW